MSKISITGIESRDKAIKGMKYVADAVKASIGPFGLNHMSEKGNKISNDGATIGDALTPTIVDEFERRGAIVANNVCHEVNDLVGDFSSTTWAVMSSMVQEAVRYLPNANSIKSKKTHSEIARMFDESSKNVIKLLEERAKPVESKEELIKCALVSVENEKIAELLGDMQWELGPHGRIIAEEVNELDTSIERVKGIRIDNGFGASHFANDEEGKSLVLPEISVFLTNYTMDAKEILEMKPVFEQLIAQKRWGIALIARAFTSEAIKLCTESLKTGFAIFPINAPYVNQAEIMHDIEAVVGGRFIGTEESSLSDVYITDIGFAKRIIARLGEGIITGLDDDKAKERVEKRVEKLKNSLAGEKSVYYKRTIEERIAQLTTGFAILKVGSEDLTERKRLKDKCDDAVNTVRLCLKGGTVRGAGVELKEISEQLPDDDILKRPLRVIYDHIITSAPDGWEIPEWVRDSVIGLTTVITKTSKFAPTFASINSADTTKNPKECKCNATAGNEE